MLGNRASRRKARHERNVMKEEAYKKEARLKGKLIEENHNDGPYSVAWTMTVTSALVRILLEAKERGNLANVVRDRKKRMIDCILHYNPSVPKGPDYHYIKKLLEVYWDEVVPFGNDNALLGV